MGHYGRESSTRDDATSLATSDGCLVTTPDLDSLACPRDHDRLARRSDELVCGSGHRFPIVDGIPVFVLKQGGGGASYRPVQDEPNPSYARDGGVHPYVNAMIGTTNGNLYAHLRGKLPRYPIPALRLRDGGGRRLLDIGCNWGRWVVAAARKGYRVTGMDLSLRALRAAKVVARQCGVEADFVCGDARAMPFRDGAFDVAYSYSVVQHFSRDDARSILGETARVLTVGGESMIQMANRWGVRSLYQLSKRGFSEAHGFDVRYWTLRELQTTFGTLIGESRVSVDGFFGLDVQASDLDLMPLRYRLVIRGSEALRRAAALMPPMKGIADSVYVHSVKR